MTRITAWTRDQQLEMLQLVNYSYETQIRRQENCRTSR